MGKWLLSEKLQPGLHKLTCESECKLVTQQGDNVLLLHRFQGETKVRLNEPADVVSDEPCFRWDAVRDQTNHKTSDIVFTSLERPAAMSQEMLAMHMMMKRNEIEREHMYQRMERLTDANRLRNNGARDSGSAKVDTANAKKGVRGSPEPVSADAAPPESGDDSEKAAAARKDAGRQDSDPDHESGGERGNSASGGKRVQPDDGT